MHDPDTNRELTVYKDEHFALLLDDGICYFMIGSIRYTLSCHPYEPCLFITGEDRKIAVHNSFNPAVAAEMFAEGGTVVSVTGKTYWPLDFCRMLEFAVTVIGCDTDISYVEGAAAVKRMIEIGATEPEKAVHLKELGLGVISNCFSHSKKLRHRVMYTADGRVYVRIKG